MASERPIRRKPCSHANNFESLIAFRNTYVWGGGGDGGKRGWGRFKWFSGCNRLTVIFFSFFSFSFILFLSIYILLSLSPQQRKKKKKKKTACTRTPKFLCIFLRNARPPPTPPPSPATSPHTNGNSFKSLNTSLSSRCVCVGGGGEVLGPQLGTDA